MKSSSEELEKFSGELRSSNEELQSINEELNTVATELQIRVGDLSRADDDMNDLLAGAGIGTVFVDLQLPSHGSLVADMESVLHTLMPREVEVSTHDGKSFTMRMLPYRTLDNVIEGAVISFVDITATAQAREALVRTAELLERTGQIGLMQLNRAEVLEPCLSSRLTR